MKTFLRSPGHLRFMRGYLSSVAPSFSNQEAAEPTNSGQSFSPQYREAWRGKAGVFFYVCLFLFTLKKRTVSLYLRRTWHTAVIHVDFSSVSLKLTSEFPINNPLIKAFLNFDTSVSFSVLFVSLSAGWNMLGGAGLGPGTLDSCSIQWLRAGISIITCDTNREKDLIFF